ncbi:MULTISPECIES: DUF4097 family beta strand repeat-containing protein [unclassified Clostridium]|uniref:DUF4097 family beta strand repeat-containing protein n=1 Tax=unclassified Clostridium TaxID=2614128 RepID=UPI0013EED4D4|nr:MULTISPECIES: DUF4097 family beta strand repeat-containing protein [unclassified Clostridium]MBZ9692404.1 DUF4097 domain-containing protein [Clostridium sp. M14]
MKKLLILAILGIVLISSVGCNTNSKTKTTTSNQESETLNENKVIDEKINLDNATDIDVEIYAAQVSIKSYDGEEVKVTGKLSQKSDGLGVKRNGHEIQVIEKEYKSSRLDMNGEKNISRLDIMVPSKFKGNFKFDQGAGILDIEGIKAKNIDISGGSVKSKCEDIKFDKLNLESGASEFDLNLKEKCGDIKINGGVGKLKLKMAEVGGNLEYEGGVGEIDIIIPKNSPVNIVTEKGDGHYNINAQTSGEEKYTFDLSVGIGSINVRN